MIRYLDIPTFLTTIPVYLLCKNCFQLQQISRWNLIEQPIDPCGTRRIKANKPGVYIMVFYRYGRKIIEDQTKRKHTL